MIKENMINTLQNAANVLYSFLKINKSIDVENYSNIADIYFEVVDLIDNFDDMADTALKYKYNKALKKYNDFKNSYKKIIEAYIPNYRRFNHTNPGAVFRCPNCGHVWSFDARQHKPWLLNFCPNCGTNIKNEIIESDIAEKVQELYPEVSILGYGNFKLE